MALLISFHTCIFNFKNVRHHWYAQDHLYYQTAECCDPYNGGGLQTAESHDLSVAVGGRFAAAVVV